MNFAGKGISCTNDGFYMLHVYVPLLAVCIYERLSYTVSCSSAMMCLYWGQSLNSSQN